ncbi:MAG: DegV family protein [Anaerolineales bacterium]|nr:DegV family protein [Anaerolineales bacterium]
MRKVIVVTDSIASVPQELVDELEIRVVPAIVIWGEEQLKEGIDITAEQFFPRLKKSKVIPTTTQPGPEDFRVVFEDILSRGYDVLGVFISNKLSGTFNSAYQARKLFPDVQDRIIVIDSLLASMGTGWGAIDAARAAASGANLATCAEIAQKTLENTLVVLMVDTLEYLHRGGRIGGASRLVGTMLSFKPILQLVDGQLEPRDKVRTRKKAMEYLLTVGEEFASNGTARVATMYTDNKEEAQSLNAHLAKRYNAVETVISCVSPAIGVHVGPGTIALVITVSPDGVQE